MGWEEIKLEGALDAKGFFPTRFASQQRYILTMGHIPLRYHCDFSPTKERNTDVEGMFERGESGGVKQIENSPVLDGIGDVGYELAIAAACD